MIVLQGNIDRGREAMDLMYKIAEDENADIMIIAEPNRKKATRGKLYVDNQTDVAIVIRNAKHVIRNVIKGDGFVCIELDEVMIFGCYISPNVDIQTYTRFLANLRAEMKQKYKEVIVGGDFNSKSYLWQSKVEDRRGQILAEWLAEEDLIVLNQGDTPTFVRGYSESHIDITFCTRGLSKRVTQWRVLQGETLSCHQHIVYHLEKTNANRNEINKRNTGWVINKEDIQKVVEEVGKTFEKSNSSDMNAEVVRKTLTDACNKIMKKKASPRNKRPVYWWTEETAQKRQICTKMKRIKTRENKKNDTVKKQAALENYRQSRADLKNAIMNAKEQAWKKVIEEVECDIWGRGYQIVMGKLKKAPTTILKDEQQLVIAQELFPKHDTKTWDRMPVIKSQVPLFTEAALKMACAKIKEKKAPGPDAIPPEVINATVNRYPKIMLDFLNNILKNGIFPTEWKDAKLVLLEKVKPGQIGKSYRPICLLNVMAKLAEQLILQRLKLEIEINGDFSEEQYGFRQGRSTINALKKIQGIADEANERAGRRRCLLVTMDVKNAFNSAPWDGILTELKRRQIAPYLYNIIASYLEERWLYVGENSKMRLTCGVPQGSVLGPTLWNIYYDGVLRIPVPRSVNLVAYADDLAIVTVEKDAKKLQDTTNKAIDTVLRWMKSKQLSVAPEKTEVVILAGGRTVKQVEITVGNIKMRSQDQIKYLGVYLDRNMRMGQHIKNVVKKAEKAIGNLSRILPNIGGPKERNRKILANVVNSLVLYGADIWKRAMAKITYKNCMISLQRKTAIRIVSAYRTTPTKALLVIARTPPIYLMVEERRAVSEGQNRKSAYENTLQLWQEEWKKDTGKGKWTQRLIPSLEPWITRKHGEVDYHLTQLISGHGCFQYYRHRFKLAETSDCLYCGREDTVEHTFFECERWAVYRRTAEEITGQISPQNVIVKMLESDANWKAIHNLTKCVITSKEKHIRTIERR